MGNKRYLRSALLATGAIVAVSSVTPAMAQAVIEEIMVTATKRPENVQSIPISVTAVTAEELDRAGITDITRLDYLAPGLSLGQSGSDARPSIRGARTETTNERQDPVIGFFVDGIYQSRTSQALAGFYDVQRVEVLRGPQGTLFGRNTFGGAISVVSNAPDTDDYDYRLTGEYGSFDRTRLDGFVNIPLSDDLAFRFAGAFDRDDGFIENLSDPQNNLGQRDSDNMRFSLMWEPTDNFDVTARVSTWDEGGIGGGDFGYTVIGTVRDPATGTTDLNGVFDPNNPRSGSGASPADPGPYQVLRDTPLTRRTDAINYSLEMNLDLGDVLVKSITGYQSFEAFRLNDSDFSNEPGSFSSVGTDTESFSQELQFISNTDGPLQWVGGAYLFIDDTEETFLFEVLCPSADLDGDPTTATVCTGPNTSPETIAFGARGVVDTTSFAFFGQATYELTDRLSVTAGLRYTNDDKEFDRFDEDQFLNNGVTLQIVDEDATFDRVTWRAGLDYQLTDDSLLYASASTGFNSGGFNTAGAELSFGPQTVRAYEIGSKNTLLDGSLILNVAAYYNDYTDLLAQGFIATGPTVSVFSTNAGEAEALGIEVEADWAPVENLYLTAAASFTDTKVGEFVVGNPFVLGGESFTLGNGIAVDASENRLNLDGSDIAQSPQFTLTLTGRYDFDLGDYGTLTPSVQFYYSDSYLTNDVTFPGSVQGSYTRTDLRIAWMAPDERLMVEGFVNNLEDEAVLNRTVVGGQDAIFANYRRPQTFGVRLTVRR